MNQIVLESRDQRHAENGEAETPAPLENADAEEHDLETEECTPNDPIYEEDITAARNTLMDGSDDEWWEHESVDDECGPDSEQHSVVEVDTDHADWSENEITGLTQSGADRQDEDDQDHVRRGDGRGGGTNATPSSTTTPFTSWSSWRKGTSCAQPRPCDPKVAPILLPTRDGRGAGQGQR